MCDGRGSKYLDSQVFHQAPQQHPATVALRSDMPRCLKGTAVASHLPCFTSLISLTPTSNLGDRATTNHLLPVVSHHPSFLSQHMRLMRVVEAAVDGTAACRQRVTMGTGNDDDV
ncbi:hypothetical protein HaLaN_25194 [Haematococcus lacustris]|uniref:Uncharacterized protein n=1 Tax=Haematococcus lacustris TaxID=44745 RepID=A0A6A0A3C3_HAELA|nr:hypothetical protein HaLaN_25194 [Haematococcus lacustris]